MRTALITLTCGRHAHLRRQHRATLLQSHPPDRYICVGMGDGTVPELDRLRILPMCGAPDLPLAAARNRGAADAIAGGAELLIFLDVDCIPGRELVGAYAAAAEARAEDPPLVLCGPIGYLPAPIEGDLSESDLAVLAYEHPERRAQTTDQLEDHNLFWSLSFATTARSWLAVGGFCEEYTGYGGEDTDFAQLLVAAGGTLHWVGDARAYHQHHESHDPPTQHVASVIRNAEVFRRRWGWYPMITWLEEFERRGLAARDRRGSWMQTGGGARSSRSKP